MTQRTFYYMEYSKDTSETKKKTFQGTQLYYSYGINH